MSFMISPMQTHHAKQRRDRTRVTLIAAVQMFKSRKMLESKHIFGV